MGSRAVKLVLDDMPVNDAIELYYEKHHALRHGDMAKLIELKTKCPEIFDNEKDRQIRNMIQHAKEFRESERYNELWRQVMRDKLTLIINNPLND